MAAEWQALGPLAYINTGAVSGSADYTTTA